MSEPKDNPFESEDNPTYGGSVGLEGSFPMRAEHSEKDNRTLRKAISEKKKNRFDNCNRLLLVMIKWIKETYPDTADDSNPNHLLPTTSTNHSCSSMET